MSSSPGSTPTIEAVEKYPCAACGAQAEWNPTRQLLVCGFCGTSAPFSRDAATGALVEHDLVKALREYKSQERRGYDPSMVDVARQLGDAEILDLAYYLANWR